MRNQSPDDPKTLWTNLNRLLAEGPLSDAEDLANRLLAIAEQRQAAGDATAVHLLADALIRQGSIASQRGRTADAETAFTRALGVGRQALALEPTDCESRERLASLHYNLGILYSNSGRYKEAEATYLAALLLQEANCQAQPEVPRLRNHLAQTQFNLGNALLAREAWAEAAMRFRQARELWLGLVAVEPHEWMHAHNLGRSYFNFAFVCGQQASPEALQQTSAEALDAYERGQEVWIRLLQTHPDLLEPRYDLARCYFNHSVLLVALGRQEEALATIERALPQCQRLLELAPGNPEYQSFLQQATEQQQGLASNDPARVAAQQLAEVDRLASELRSTGQVLQLRNLGASVLTLAQDFCQAQRPVEMEQVYRKVTALVAEAAQSDPTSDSAHLEAAVWFDLNIDLRSLRCYDGAEEAVRLAIRRWTRLHIRYPSESKFLTWLAGAYNHLGITCADTCRDASALAHYHTSLALRERLGRISPNDPENQLYLAGTYCNIGNVYLERGQLSEAQDFYQRALQTMEPVAVRLAHVPQLAEFQNNTRDGLSACQSRVPFASNPIQTATLSWPLPAPPALVLDDIDADLAASLRSVDALRLSQDPGAEAATADLVTRFPESAEAWLLRGWVLGQFTGGDQHVRSDEARFELACAAFYEALVCRSECYEARLGKGLLLGQGAHAAQAHYRALLGLSSSLAEAEHKARLAVQQRRFQTMLSRACESLQTAARQQPKAGQPWAELFRLYHGLGYPTEAQPFLERLCSLDAAWAERLSGQ